MLDRLGPEGLKRIKKLKENENPNEIYTYDRLLKRKAIEGFREKLENPHVPHLKILGEELYQHCLDWIEKQRQVFEEMGCRVEKSAPDFRDADEIFKIWRAWRMELALSELLPAHRDQLKDTVIWNIEEGMKLSGPQIGQAERKRTELYHRVRQFMETYEFLVLPVSQVPPFDVKQRYVTEINSIKMDSYIDWMKSCYFISVTGLPAISVPCGFTPDGLPVGIQIVGRHQDDFGVLQLAYAFEQTTEFWKRRPPVVD